LSPSFFVAFARARPPWLRRTFIVIVGFFAFSVKAVSMPKEHILRRCAGLFRFPHLAQENAFIFGGYFNFSAIFATCCHPAHYV
jgi:hypothetical protein